MKNFSFVLGPRFSEGAYSKHLVASVALKNFFRIPATFEGPTPSAFRTLSCQYLPEGRRDRDGGEAWPCMFPGLERWVALPASSQPDATRARKKRWGGADRWRLSLVYAM